MHVNNLIYYKSFSLIKIDILILFIMRKLSIFKIKKLIIINALYINCAAL